MDGRRMNGYNVEKDCLLEIRDLQVSYQKGTTAAGRNSREPQTAVLDGVNLTVKKGCLTALLGVNGSGKTTLLKAACGLIPFRKGGVTVCGRDLTEFGRRELASCISYIPQKNSILYHIRTDEVVVMGANPRLSWYEAPSAAHRREARELLGQMGLLEEADRDFLTLSEGQKQLALLCRALMQNAPVMMFDEPDSALDYGNRRMILSRISGIIREKKYGGLITIHDPDYALRYCDEIVILKNGRIRETVYCRNGTEEGRKEAERKLRMIYPDLELLSFNGRFLTVK